MNEIDTPRETLPSQGGTLYLLRHGESEWNQENRFTGWSDVPLTVRGVQEMEAAGEKLRGLPIHTIYSSSLLRTWNSARVVRAAAGLDGAEIIPAAELNERDYGDLTGLNKDETVAQYGADLVRLWRRSYTTKPPGGESLKDAAEGRIVPFFETAIVPRIAGAGESILVCAHGNTLRAVIMHIEGLTEDEVAGLEIPTGGLYRYAPTNGTDFSFIERQAAWIGGPF